MNRTMFHRRIPASRKLRMLAAAAIAALALSACGGGGGGISSGGGESPAGPAGLSPGLTAGGVRAVISHRSSDARITIYKGENFWSTEATFTPEPPAGWSWFARHNAAKTEFAHAATNIDAFDDDDYLAYGYWTAWPIASINNFSQFYYGSKPYTGNVRALTGSATYRGGAMGVYAFNAEHGSTEADGGFTAEVEMTVSFGQSGEAASLDWTMRSFNTHASASAGAVKAEITDTDFGTLLTRAAGPGFTGTDARGNKWGGRFYGPSGGVPTGVAGWFQGLYVGLSHADHQQGDFVRLSGSFGAEKEKE